MNHTDRLTGQTAPVRKLPPGKPNREVIAQAKKAIGNYYHPRKGNPNLGKTVIYRHDPDQSVPLPKAIWRSGYR